MFHVLLINAFTYPRPLRFPSSAKETKNFFSFRLPSSRIWIPETLDAASRIGSTFFYHMERRPQSTTHIYPQEHLLTGQRSWVSCNPTWRFNGTEPMRRHQTPAAQTRPSPRAPPKTSPHFQNHTSIGSSLRTHCKIVSIEKAFLECNHLVGPLWNSPL